MTKQPEDWLDDVPGDDVEDEDDEIIWVSKSEIKRDAEELKRLGAEMVELGKNALDKIPLDTDLRDAIELAQRIKKEGRRRQMQLIGKMLRSRDVEPIRQALDKLKNRHNQQVALFHKLEQIRDRLIDNGDDAVAEVLNLWYRCRSSAAAFADPQRQKRERRQQAAEVRASYLPVPARTGTESEG
ncbi:ribosome biogenesis factor YjgA [Klebsiella michiganensis]|nr:ribosome biogenesis factor YjgA [Klebsiella michiganensis]